MTESQNFTYWLSTFGKPTITPKQLKEMTDIDPHETEENLIYILYYAESKLAAKALEQLIYLFECELVALEENNRDRELHANYRN